MNSRTKLFMKVIAVMVFIVVICFLLMIPAVAKKVSQVSGVAADKIRSVAATVAGIAIGIVLLSFGVTALAALPIVGIGLIVIGLSILAYSVWPLFSPGRPSMTVLGDKGLQKIVG